LISVIKRNLIDFEILFCTGDTSYFVIDSLNKLLIIPIFDTIFSLELFLFENNLLD